MKNRIKIMKKYNINREVNMHSQINDMSIEDYKLL